MPSPETPRPPLSDGAKSTYRRKGLLSFTIFFVFFVFYIGTAVIQTPNLRAVASLPCWGMPLGLLLSLLIFPVSWVLIVIYFRLGR
jgi:hypothetical protein